MSIPQPPQPPDPLLGPLGPAVQKPRDPGPGWRLKERKPGYAIWAKVENGKERWAVVPDGM